MKNLYLLIISFILLLAGCDFSSLNDPDPDDPDPNNPDGPKTIVVFDNTQGACAAVVYSNPSREINTIITVVPAGDLSREIEWTPGVSVPFFFSYNISLIGINDFTVNHMAESGEWNQTYIRVDADKKTNIVIPSIVDTVASANDFLANKNSFIIIQNSSSRSIQLNRGSNVLTTDSNTGGANPGERVSYTLKESDVRTASSYSIGAMGTTTMLTTIPTANFELGRVYYVNFGNRDTSLDIVEIKIANLTVGSLNDPINKTNVRFINEDDFSVSIYTNHQRNNLISDVAAKGRSGSILTDPNISAVYYPNYNIVIEDVSIPYEGGAIVARIDPKKTAALPNDVYIPSLIRMLNAPGADPTELTKPLTSSVYIKVHNDVNYTLSLRRQGQNLFPQGSTSPVVNARETAIYIIDSPGPVTNFEFREGTSIPMSFTGLGFTQFQAGWVYSFRVVAGSPTNRLELLAERPLTIAEAFILNPPKNINARNLPSGSISVTWDRAGTETSYEIYRSVNSSSFNLIGSPSNTSYIDANVTSGNTYSYKIISVRDSTKSEMSDGSVPLLAASSTLPSPAGVTVTVQGASSISLSWTAVSGANNYIIYQGSTQTGVNTYVGQAASPPFLVTGLEGDTLYWFTVSAASSTAESNPSAAVSGRTPQTLLAEEWKDDSIATGQTKEYYINVTEGDYYFISWNDRYSGNGTKTADIYVTALYDNGTVVFPRTDSAWTSPKLFVSNITGSVVLRVESGNGTFSIRYQTREGGRTALSEDVWASDNLMASDQINEYTINVTKDTYYFIYWNDRYSGNGLKTSDIYVSAIYDSGSSSDAPFTRVDSAWNAPKHFISDRNGVLILRVNGSIGTYDIRYTSRPGGVRPLSNGVWMDDSLTAPDQLNYYSFSVTRGSTYYVWWNDRYSGNGTKTSDIYVTAQYGSGSSSEAPFTRVDSAWNEPRSFTATSTGTVTLTVSGGIGTYAIAYRTTIIRP